MPLRNLPSRGFQSVLILLCSVCLPYLAIVVVETGIGFLDRSLFNSFLGSSFAVMFGLLLNLRLQKFPGAAPVARPVIPYLLGFAIVMMTLLLFRFEYSRSLLALSAAVSLLMVSVLGLRRQVTRPLHFWSVPGGRTLQVDAYTPVKVEQLREPVLPSDPRDGIVADFHAEIDDEWEKLLATAALREIPVYYYKQVEEALTGKVDVDRIAENAWGALSPDPGYVRVKRVSDLMFSLILLPVLLPILALTALAVRLDSSGPVLFFQQRVGKGGASFRMVKFRSMSVNHSRGDALTTAITEDNDDRITRVGRIIRRYRLDELPQVFNVIAGQMSWIGPRPEAQELGDWYERELPFYSYRNIVLPGITGWAQVNQGHVSTLSDVHDKLRYDFYYIKHFSMWLDVLIVARTIKTVLGGFGAR
jgi:lipopolysaccharide/colanic/teichoic acid biosynthesis glycosyltransferase